ncbi:olfactory receptor 11A1-like [Boleophthalmus pectinirostris]|uniref:olfactory receptor 11A1-like n=1 Tax=Boleophthalmus pectinirostris TaxID=150288 RepID=UPI002430107B|nr:olfactory receptor 11A1-like [Boleophthalmus pectinirostris]
MVNSSQVSHFTLGAYFDTGSLRWLYFLIILCVYASILFSNLLLIVVICLNRTLHEPMYIFLCSLFVNELWGSAGLFPFLLVQMLQDVHTVSYTFCFLQIFCLYVYASTEMFTLSAMAYDRYLAICFPLQYNVRMNTCKISGLIFVSWLYPLCAIITVQILAASLDLCGNAIPTVYCNNFYIVQLACGKTVVHNILGLANLFVTVFCPLSVILFSYICILRVCFNGSKQARQKALSTCTPHIASVINLCFGMLFEVVQSRFDMTNVPKLMRILLSVYFLALQPLFNPAMYGLKLTKVRVLCRNTLRRTK